MSKKGNKVEVREIELTLEQRQNKAKLLCESGAAECPSLGNGKFFNPVDIGCRDCKLKANTEYTLCESIFIDLQKSKPVIRGEKPKNKRQGDKTGDAIEYLLECMINGFAIKRDHARDYMLSLHAENLKTKSIESIPSNETKTEKEISDMIDKKAQSLICHPCNIMSKLQGIMSERKLSITENPVIQ